jgi:hypothetical protein
MKTIVAIVAFLVMVFAVAAFADTFEGEWRNGPDGSIYVYTGRMTVQVYPYSREAADTLKLYASSESKESSLRAARKLGLAGSYT